MNFGEIDALVRKALPDGEDRRNILTAVHDLQEALNHHCGYLLAVTGHKWDESTESWSKDTNVKRNVNPPL
mgnify:CR=1 FL=1